MKPARPPSSSLQINRGVESLKLGLRSVGSGELPVHPHHRPVQLGLLGRDLGTEADQRAVKFLERMLVPRVTASGVTPLVAAGR